MYKKCREVPDCPSGAEENDLGWEVAVGSKPNQKKKKLSERAAGKSARYSKGNFHYCCDNPITGDPYCWRR